MTDADEYETVLSAVRERLDPDEGERAQLREAVRELVARTGEAVADFPVETDVVQVGSTARDTWLSGDRDVDVFVRFPPDLDREALERYGLRVGNEVLPDGREEFAEHPYVKGEFEGITVDLVPCYRVESATDIQSAVDRTPFHNDYVAERLDDDLAAEVRLLKGFLSAIGAYGSDLRTKGFSGYLTELLILEYGSFLDLLDAAADWHPPVELDPEDHGTREFDDPLVVVDPTDPTRNVAAVLSAANVARLQHYAREFLADPREELFFSTGPDPLSAAEIRTHVVDRDTTPVAVRFSAPDVVEDQLYPQLEKSLAGVRSELERREFEVLRADVFADGDAVLFVELAVADLPAVERHEGPPVHVREHAEGFSEKYADADVYGPFVDGGRYVVERDREFASAAEFLASDAIFDVSLGPDVTRAFREGYEVVVGEEIAALAEEFGRDLARYFDPRP
jgi:tRNA nucleotidyltransferase (CCA-adding enzyme)